MWIISLCRLLSVGYTGQQPQHDRNTQVANTQHFGWVFATWVFTTLGIVEVGYSVLLPIKMQLEQHFPSNNIYLCLSFNIRHIKHIEIIICYLADAARNFPYHFKNNCAN